ncbi:LOW QUALITY PROTEIN: secreted protein associated with spyDAC [Geomicrobium sp. JCM 19055]|nr:LOW QUALITY PROTEIN: secreted protein associated with spyDAC [Geomicrobium sp. JCM 19055]
MDRLFNNNWFLKLISLVIATMLFLFVNMDDFGNRPGATPIMSTEQIQLDEAELDIYYDDEQYAIASIDDDIDVRVSGTQSALTLFQVTNPSYEVYVDLSEHGTGFIVDVQTANFPSGLNVSVEPSTVRVVLEERQAVTLPVDVELMNEEQIAEGHTIGDPEVNPGEVEVHAGASVLDNITSLQAFVDVAGADETFTEVVEVIAYGPYGEQLDAHIDPEAVEITVPIRLPSKEVPLEYDTTGELEDGLEVLEMTLSDEAVTIYGRYDDINDIDSIHIGTLDLSSIEESETREVEIPLPDGVSYVRPEVIELDILLDEFEESTSLDLEIEMDNLPETYNASIPEEQDGDRAYRVTVHGDEEALSELSEEDIRLYIDFSEEELETGEQVVPIQVEGPNDLEYRLEVEEVPVEITETVAGE